VDQQQRSAEEFFDSLRFLDRDKTIGAAAARAFYWIWLRAGMRVYPQNEDDDRGLRFQLSELAERYGKSLRTAQDWLDRLERAEVISCLNRTQRGMVPEGEIVLYVFHPNPVVRKQTPRPKRDRQLRFGFVDAIAEEDTAVANGEVSSRPRTATGPCSVARVNGRGLPRTPCREAVKEAVGAGKMPLAEAFQMIAGRQRGGPPAVVPGPAPPAGVSRAPPVARPRQADSGQPIEQISRRIQEELQDERLFAGPRRNVAARVANGQLAWATVAQVIECAIARHAEAPDSNPRWAYFVGTMKRIFAEHGWAWRRRQQREGLHGAYY